MEDLQAEENSFVIATQPGIQRDGTSLDSNRYIDGQWVRFQRGRPRKIGGYVRTARDLFGPVRATYVSSAPGGSYIHTFSQEGVERTFIDQYGAGGGSVLRTPAGFVRADYTWSTDALFSSTGGGSGVLVAAATPDIDDLTSDATGPVYQGDLDTSAAFQQISDSLGPILVSGGCCVLQPFLFVYGSRGLIRNSTANDFTPTGWTVGGGSFANVANVAGTKVVHGAPIRGGGRSPAGLFWALDSLIRVSFVNNGVVLWQYDTISSAISVLSKKAIVEYDGSFYWPGVDRFFFFNGVVQELPNDVNLNFFFDSITPSARNKVWAWKNTRFGEIWWLFPRDGATECNHALIFNVRERTWYDTPLVRTAGTPAQVVTFPIAAGGASTLTTSFEVALSTGRAPIVGDEFLNAGFVAPVLRVDGTRATVGREISMAAPPSAISSWRRDGVVVGTGFVGAPLDQTVLDSIWVHEKGYDAVTEQDFSIIPAYVQTNYFTWQLGGPATDAPAGPALQTRLVSVEPDFVLSGGMSLRVTGTSYAQATPEVSVDYPFDSTTQLITPREQRRQMSLIFESNSLGGNFEMGQVLVTVQPGDARG